MYEEKHFMNTQKPPVLKIQIKSFSRKKLEKEKMKQIQKNQENQNKKNFIYPGVHLEEISYSQNITNKSTVLSERTQKYKLSPMTHTHRINSKVVSKSKLNIYFYN